MSPLAPLKHALAAVMATTHDALAALGVSADSAVTWVLGIASLVVLVRLLLLPFVIHGVRQAHAGARARPHLKGITERYRGRTDAESLRAHMDERRAVSAEHGVSRLGCLPVLVQLPVWLALYHLVSDVAHGTAVGAMGPGLVSSFGPPPSSARSPATATSAPVASTSRRGRARADRGRAVVRHPAVRGRAQHVRGGHAGGVWSRRSAHARDVGRRDAARRRRGAGGTAGLLGVQLDVECSPSRRRSHAGGPPPGRRRPRATSWRDDEVADLAAGVDDAVGLTISVSGSVRTDHRPQLPRREALEQPREVGGDPPRILRRGRSHGRGRCRRAPRRRAPAHLTARAGGGPSARSQVADRVEHDVVRRSPGRGPTSGCGRPPRPPPSEPTSSALRSAADRGHVRAGQVRDLHGRRPDRAGRAVHQDAAGRVPPGSSRKWRAVLPPKRTAAASSCETPARHRREAVGADGRRAGVAPIRRPVIPQPRRRS